MMEVKDIVLTPLLLYHPNILNLCLHSWRLCHTHTLITPSVSTHLCPSIHKILHTLFFSLPYFYLFNLLYFHCPAIPTPVSVSPLRATAILYSHIPICDRRWQPLHIYNFNYTHSHLTFTYMHKLIDVTLDTVVTVAFYDEYPSMCYSVHNALRGHIINYYYHIIFIPPLQLCGSHSSSVCQLNISK